MRRAIAGLSAVVVAAAGYLTLDAYDVVPGVLTLDDPQPVAVPADEDPVVPEGDVPTLVAAAPVLDPLASDAPVPTEAGVEEAIGSDLEDDWLGSRVGAVVRDGETGEVLYAKDADRAQLPASTQKILSAAAVSEKADLGRTMTTRVVRDGDELVLVAGGDTMLAKGAGDPAEVEGRAGLKELATQVADALGEDGAAEGLTLRLDATYAAGPRYPDTWNMADVSSGFTQGVSMIGLAGERPEPYKPSPTYPERSVLSAFADRLEEAGVEVEVDDAGSTWSQAASADAEELGSVESAPLGEVLTLALVTSDNALTEGVVRQVAAADGAGTDFEDMSAWIVDTLGEAGVDTTGMELLDASGLSRGQKVSAQAISEAMQLGVGPDATGLRGVLAGLPVAAVDGTLHDRFLTQDSRPAAGVARAKTGTLTGISSLAGTTVTEDGRLLTYVVLADKVPTSTGTLSAREVLDRIVADLTACGCR